MKTATKYELITDTQGNYVWGDKPQPEPGSVLLTSGERGTMWQRHASDGLWHNTLGRPALSWGLLTARYRNTVLVYDAPTQVERV